MKELTLKTLGSPNSKVGQVAAQFTAAIAAIEFPVAQWLNVIEMLLGFMNQGSTQLRVATLQTIGFICESIVSYVSLCFDDLSDAIILETRTSRIAFK